MDRIKKESVLHELEKIPGIDHKGAEDLWSAGVRSLRDLKGNNPDNLYDKLCYRKKRDIDRCVLYQFRCAVYYASEEKHFPQLLKWWNWKD